MQMVYHLLSVSMRQYQLPHMVTGGADTEVVKCPVPLSPVVTTLSGAILDHAGLSVLFLMSIAIGPISRSLSCACWSSCEVQASSLPLSGLLTVQLTGHWSWLAGTAVPCICKGFRALVELQGVTFHTTPSLHFPSSDLSCSTSLTFCCSQNLQSGIQDHLESVGIYVFPLTDAQW